MVRFLWAMTAVFAFLVVNTDSQSTKRQPTQKQTKPPVVKETLLPAGYEIDATVLKGLGIFIMGIAPTPTYPATDESAFQAFLYDHFGMKPSTPPHAKRDYPKVVIKFGEEDDISTLVNSINVVRVSDKIVVELQNLLDPMRFIVSPKEKSSDLLNVKPNPLTLVVAMDEQNNITLNNDEMGKLSDLSTVANFLRNIYLDREKNGVFREDSNEIEKTVFIKMPLKASAGDLIKIAKALEKVGADRIGLSIDEPVDERKELLDALPTVPKRPKSLLDTVPTIPKKKKPNY